MAAWRSANAARPAAGTSPPAVTSVTAATIASYQPRTAPVSASGSPSEWVTIAAASGPAKARRSSAAPAGSNGVDQPVDLVGDHVGEALPDGLQAKRPRERRAVALVLVAVEREHARPDDPPGREPRVVDGERVGVAHDVQREVAAQDEPAAQRGHPRRAARARAAGRGRA